MSVSATTPSKKGTTELPSIRPGSSGGNDTASVKTSKKANGPTSATKKPTISSHRLIELEEELTEQKGELLRREEYMRGVQRNYATLAKICSKNIEEIHDLQDQLDDTKLRYQDLAKQEEKFVAMQEEQIAAQQIIQAHKAQLKESEEYNQSLSTKCYDYQSHIADLNDIKEELSSQLARIQALASTRKDEIRDLQNAVKDKTSKETIARLTTENEALKAQHREALDEAEYQKNQVKTSNVGLQKVNNQLKRVTMDRDDAQDTLKRLRSNHNTQKEQIDELKKLLSESQGKYEALYLDHSALQTELSGYQRSDPELRERLAFTENARRTLQEQFDNLWQAKITVDIEKKEGLDRLHLLHLQLEKSLADRAKDKEEMDRQVSVAMKGKTSLVESQYDLEHRATDAEKRAKLVEEQLALLQGKNATLRKEKYQAVSELEAVKKTLEQKEAELDRDPMKMDTIAVAPEDEDAHNPQMMRQLRKECEFYKTQLKQVQSLSNTTNNEFAEARRELSSLYKKVKKLEEDALQASKRTDKQREDYMARAQEEFTQRLESLQNSTAELQTRLIQQQHKNAELQSALDLKPKEDPLDKAAIRRKEKELQVAIAKLIVSEEATEASFTCIQCIKIYKEPVTCIPCGHSFCAGCVKSLGHCSQCGPDLKITHYPNELLDDLASKYMFRKQAIAGLKRMSFKLTADVY